MLLTSERILWCETSGLDPTVAAFWHEITEFGEIGQDGFEVRTDRGAYIAVNRFADVVAFTPREKQLTGAGIRSMVRLRSRAGTG